MKYCKVIDCGLDKFLQNEQIGKVLHWCDFLPILETKQLKKIQLKIGYDLQSKQISFRVQ